MSEHIIKTEYITLSITKDEKVWFDEEHESVHYMLELIRKHGVKDKTVMDIGTGTGILAIFCKKIGASSVLAIDVEDFAVECAKKNADTNGIEIETKINFLTEGIEDKVDVVVANLPGPVQIDNLRTIEKNLKEDSIIIASWWNKLMFDRYIEGFEVIDCILGDDYDAYVLKKEV